MIAAVSELAGSVAVVTGAGNGIGAELARQLALAGMQVVLADISEESAQVQAKRIADAGGFCVARRLDVSDPHATDALASYVERDLGPVRMLINNAGVEVLGRSWEIPFDMWDRIMRVNLHGPVNMTRSFLPGMAAKEVLSYVSNICSIGALISISMQAGYIASKHALLSYTECLWLDVQSTGYPVKVSAVLPGPVQTRIFEVAEGTGSPACIDHRKQMQNMLSAHGMPVDEAAARIIAGIVAGQFWVSTHPELLARSAAQRSARLSSLSDPAPPSA